MGNTSLQKDYTISKTVLSTGGNDHLWRIYPAVHKTNKQDVCVFMATKEDIESQFGGKTITTIMDRLKLEAQLLARLRHPNILNVHTMHTESSKEIYMVTEPILGSLSNLLKDYKNLPNPSESIKKYEFFPLELRMGMCQIAEALEYCHNEHKLAHLNISPENIYITAEGTWKLAGFNFSYFESKQSATEVPQAIINDRESIVKFGQRLQKSSYLPSLNYSAPEYVIHHQPSLISDVFSFGVLYYDLVTGMQSNRGLLFSSRNIEIYKQRIMAIRDLDMDHISKPMADSLLNTLSDNPRTRLEIRTILRQMSLFGNDVNSLHILNTLSRRDTVSKAKFLRSLPRLLGTMPERIIIHRALPHLVSELKDMKTAIFALPSIFTIAENVNSKQYSHFIQPHLSRLFMQMQPAELPMKMLEYFELMLEKSSPTEQQNFILPFVVRCLESGTPEVQINAMIQTEKCFTKKLISAKDFNTHFLPEIDMLIRETSSSVVRTNGAVCLGKACSKLETDIQVQTIIPCLEHCLKVDTSATLVMTVVGVFSRISKQLRYKHIVALRILPAVFPMSVNPSLTEGQFAKFMATVKSMVDLVEQQRMQMFANASTLAKETEEKRAAGSNRLQISQKNAKEQDMKSQHEHITANGAVSDDDFFGVPLRQERMGKSTEDKREQVDDFITRFMPSESDSMEKDKPQDVIDNNQSLFDDGDVIVENLLGGAQVSTSPMLQDGSRSKKAEAVAFGDKHVDESIDRLLDISTVGQAAQMQAKSKSVAANDDLFKNLEDEWKSKVIASEKAPIRKHALYDNVSKAHGPGTSRRDIKSPSLMGPPSGTADFDNLLNRVALEGDIDDTELKFDRPSKHAPPILFDDSDPLSKISIDDADDGYLLRSPSPAFKPATTGNHSKKSSFYDGDEDDEIEGGNIAEMMASLGEYSTRTSQRTRSFFDEDEDDGQAKKISSSQEKGGDLDDLMSRFM